MGKYGGIWTKPGAKLGGMGGILLFVLYIFLSKIRGWVVWWYENQLSIYIYIYNPYITDCFGLYTYMYYSNAPSGMGGITWVVSLGSVMTLDKFEHSGLTRWCHNDVCLSFDRKGHIKCFLYSCSTQWACFNHFITYKTDACMATGFIALRYQVFLTRLTI